jgi:hypothetical protein
MKTGTFIPANQYMPPLGIPGYWMNEQSELPAAVRAYFAHRVEDKPITPEQIKLIVGYLDYFIHAPCWEQTCVGGCECDLAELRKRVKILASVESIRRWYDEAMEMGLDPF